METGETVGEEAICATNVPRACTGKLCREGPRSRFLLERRRQGRGCPRFTSRLLHTQSFPRGFPPFRRVPPRSELATSSWKAQGRLVLAVHDNDGSCVTGCGHMGGSQRWEPPCFCLEGACTACANPRSVRLPAFSRSLSRCSPLSAHAPVLPLWCADGSSSTRRTSCVLSLHRQRRPAE